MIEEQSELQGRPLKPGELFRFACRPALACFNACCRDKRLPLLPYDLLRLRRGLKQNSSDILATLVELEEDPGSGRPALRIKLQPDGVCPFVSPDGCTVYEHRPTCCRIYPLARAVQPGAGGAEPSQIFLRQDTPGCLGWEEPDELDIDAWIADQDLAPFQAANNRALKLFMHPAKKGKVSLNQAQTHAFISALYNLDGFRDLVQQEGFTAKFAISDQRLAAALKSDEELLDLGIDWLIGVLFGG